MTTCANTPVASTCGGGFHRSRTPIHLESAGGTPPILEEEGVIGTEAIPRKILLDTSAGKNWSIELTGSYVTLSIRSNAKSGRRGTITVKNDLTAATDGSLDDENCIDNVKIGVPSSANPPLIVGSESGLITGPTGLKIKPQETVMLRYYLNGPSGSACFPIIELLTSR